MSDQPLTRDVLAAVLADFHRDVFRPDIQQIVEASELSLRDEMHGLHDFVLKRLDRLEDEYQAIKAGLNRLEGQGLDLQAQVLELRTRVSRVEERLEELIALEERYPLRADVQDLKVRVDRLQKDIRRLDQRIKP